MSEYTPQSHEPEMVYVTKVSSLSVIKPADRSNPMASATEVLLGLNVHSAEEA